MTDTIELVRQATFLDYISWISSVISIIAAGVSIRQFFKIKKYRASIVVDIRRITIHKVSEHLKKAQADCRKLLSHNRGQKSDEIYMSIQENLDNAGNELNQKELDSNIRGQLDKTDKELKAIRVSGGPADKLHEMIGNAIAICNHITGEIR